MFPNGNMCHCCGHFKACYRNCTLEQIEICVFNISMKDTHAQNWETMGRLIVIAAEKRNLSLKSDIDKTHNVRNTNLTNTQEKWVNIVAILSCISKTVQMIKMINDKTSF